MTRVRVALTIVASTAVLVGVVVLRHGAVSRVLPYYADASFTPQWLAAGSSALDAVPRVGPFALTDQTGAAFTHADLAGKVAIVNLFYSACGDICPNTRRHLLRLASAYANDDRVVIVSQTATPRTDTPEHLGAFGQSNGIDARRWHLVTGADSTLGRLARDTWRLASPSGAGWGVDTIAHTERVILVDADGRTRGVYNGTLALDMQNLRADIDLLLGSLAKR